ncbi:hypothetical protein GGR50DRAFT_637320 [Xylaria sp. CBS 124048]|nr:hypothetical protein GGR50DRAFT_637320 [Xylaria sp. CBS 124048]
MESSDESTTPRESPTGTLAVVEKRRRPRYLIISPEVGSLYDILHDHAGLSLYVLPICWTDLHTQLLGCRFVRCPPYTSPTPSLSSPRPSSPSSSSSSPQHLSILRPQTLALIGRAIDALLSTDKPIFIKNRAMSAILAKLFPDSSLKPHMNSDLDLRCGRRCYPKAVRCQLLWHQADIDANALSFDSSTTYAASHAGQLLASMAVNAPSNLPVLAYVNRAHLDYVRRNGFRIMNGPGGSFNYPVHRLQALRSKTLVPKNPDEDAYILAIMVAMAQKSAYENMSRGTGFVPRSVKTCVLTVAENQKAFMVYTAIIPPAFLAKFHEPHLAAAGNSEIIVEYAQVPVWPVTSIKDRLGRALGWDLVGSVDNFPIDPYDTDSAPSPELRSPKRKREIFSEVFNASFSEDRESDRSGDIFRKRRCMGESLVGVVQ